MRIDFRKLSVVICRGSSPETTLPGEYRELFAATLNQFRTTIPSPLPLPSTLAYESTPRRWYTFYTPSSVASATSSSSPAANPASTSTSTAECNATVAPVPASAASVSTSTGAGKRKTSDSGPSRFPQFKKRQKVDADDRPTSPTTLLEDTIMHDGTSVSLAPPPATLPTAEPGADTVMHSAGFREEAGVDAPTVESRFVLGRHVLGRRRFWLGSVLPQGIN